MLPAVVLSARVSIDGIAAAQAKLASVQKSFVKTTAVADAAGKSIDRVGDKINEVRALAADPIVVDIKAKLDDTGFEEAGIKKAIFEEGVTTVLGAVVEDKGFEEGAIKKAIFESPAVTTLSAVVDDKGFEDAAIKKAIFEDPAMTTLTVKVEYENSGVSATKASIKSSADMFAASTLSKDMTKLRAWERGHPSFFAGVGAAASPAAGAHDTTDAPGFLASLLAGGVGGGARNILWGHGGEGRGGGGRRMPGWLGYAASFGAAGAGIGTAGSFAGFGAEHILFTGLGVAGSAGGAALGGGLIAGGALGQMAVGGGSDALIGASTLADTKTLGASWEKVTQAITQYGAASKQAHEASKALNEEMNMLGNTVGVKAELGLAKKAQALDHAFDLKSGGQRVEAVHIAEGGLRVGEHYMPKVLKAAKENLHIVNINLVPVFKWLKGPEADKIFATLENNFKKNIPTAIDAGSQAMEFFLKTIAVASQYTGGFVASIDRFFTKLNSPEGFAKWEVTMSHLIGDFHIWLSFFKILGKDIFDLFSQDSHTGNSIIITLTGMLTKINEWETSVSGKKELHNIFYVHREEVLALLKILPPLVIAFKGIYMTVAPPMVEAMTEILNVIAQILTLMVETGPVTRWALGLALIALKLGILGPLLSALGTKMLEQVGITKAQTDANAGLVASNEEVAASLDQVAVAQERVSLGKFSAAEGTLGGTILGGGKTLLRRAGYGGAIAIGGSIAGSLIGGKAGGIVRDAGYGAGIGMLAGPLGALAGGIAGAGIGSIATGLSGGQQSDTSGAGVRREIAKTKHLASEMKQINGKIKDDEAKVNQARKVSKKDTNEVSNAQSHLTDVVKKYGPVSNQAHKAELELAKARNQNRNALNKLGSDEKLTKNQELLRLMKAKESIIVDHETIANLQAKVEHKHKEFEQNENNTSALKKLVEAEEELLETKVKLEGSFETLKHLAPEQAENFHKIAQQAKGMEGNIHGSSGIFQELARTSHESLKKVGTSTNENSQMWQGWRGHVKEQTGLAEKDVEKFSKGSIKAMGSVMGEMNTDLGKLGVTKVNFQAGSKHHKAKGGMIVPGGGSGDKVPINIMAEPGEIVHVLNRNASGKLAQLEGINSEYRRFQKGGNTAGYTYPFGPGITWGRIDQGQDMAGSGPIAAIGNATITSGAQSGWPGTGEGFNYKFDDGPRAGQYVYVYENIKRMINIGAKVKAGQVLAQLLPAEPHLEQGFANGSGSPLAHGYYTEGEETPPGKEMHALLEALAKGGGPGIFGGGTAVSSASAPKLKKLMLEGPSGKLKELGQSAIDKVQKAAQSYLGKHAGAGTGEGEGLSVPLGPIQQMAHALVEKEWPKQNQWGPFTEVEMEEAGWDPHALYPGGTAYGLAANLTPSTYPPAGRPGSTAPILVQARAQLDWMVKYIKERYGNPAGAQAHEEAYHWYQKGGSPTHGDHKKVSSQTKSLLEQEKVFKEGLKQIKHHHVLQGMGKINKAGRALKHMEGLEPKFFNKIIAESENFQNFGEFASNASALTVPLTATQETEGKHLVPGKFRGVDQEGWLLKELASLGKLRNLLIGGSKVIGGPKNQIMKMIKDAHERMHEIIRKIREAARVKKEFEKRVKEIEQSQAAGTNKLEHEKSQLENELSKNENITKQTSGVHSKTEHLREEIKGKTAAITASNISGKGAIKELNEKIRSTGKDIHGFESTQQGIEAFIPSLEERKTNIFGTAEGLMNGGSYHNKSFAGLNEVQGKIKNLEKISPLTTQPSGLGGDILAVQLELRELGANTAVPTNTSESNEEIATLQKEINLELQKKYLTSQAQYQVFKEFPQPTSLPYAGQYAMGGMVAATVGDNGPEIALMPTGSNIVSNAERKSFIKDSGGGTTVIIEEINIAEDGTATAKVGGQTVEATVNRVNRRTATPRRTPGGKQR